MRLIGAEGEQVGIVSIRDALKNAEEAGFDLVEVAPNAKPPVCKIMDYGKYRYQMMKKHSAKHKTIELKEIKLRPQINKHDLDLKIAQMKRFIEDGNKIKVTMMFRGREIVHSSLSKSVFNAITQELSDKASIEQSGRLEGHHMTMVISPKS